MVCNQSQLIPPLSLTQYINNSPGVFSCIRAGANTGAACIRTEMNSLENLANMRKMIPQKYFPVFARVRIQAPHAFAQKLIPQDFFPACIGFVPGGIPPLSLANDLQCHAWDVRALTTHVTLEMAILTCILGPAKTYTLRGPRGPMQSKPRDHDRPIDNCKGPP